MSDDEENFLAAKNFSLHSEVVCICNLILCMNIKLGTVCEAALHLLFSYICMSCALGPIPDLIVLIIVVLIIFDV